MTTKHVLELAICTVTDKEAALAARRQAMQAVSRYPGFISWRAATACETADMLADLVEWETLEAARDACALPVLRKDFLIDPYQMLEARASGADAVLVIVAAVPEASRREDVVASARELGLDVLVEVHDEREVDLALESGADLLGINVGHGATI